MENNKKEKEINEEFDTLMVKIFYYIKQYKYFITPLFLSIYSLIYGIQFIFRTREAYRTSDVYISLARFMDLQIYGIFLLIAGLCIAFSLFLSKNISRPLMIIGSFINFLLFLVYAIISAYSAGMQSTMIIRITFAFFNLFFAVFTFLEMKVDSLINND